jgi:hypothetical protein
MAAVMIVGVDPHKGSHTAARTGTRRVVLAVDGKTVRGASTADRAAPHLLACLDGPSLH